MICADVMKTDVECCQCNDPIELVAEKMRSRNIGFVPVCDENGQVIGTLTDRDLALRVIAEHRSIATTTARDVMTGDVVFCNETDDITVAEELMGRYKKSRIVCFDENQTMVGVISLSDIAKRDVPTRASALMKEVSRREAHR